MASMASRKAQTLQPNIYIKFQIALRNNRIFTRAASGNRSCATISRIAEDVSGDVRVCKGVTVCKGGGKNSPGYHQGNGAFETATLVGGGGGGGLGVWTGKGCPGGNEAARSI